MESKAKNLIDFAARCLADEFNQRVLEGVRVIVEPYRVVFLKGETAMNTRTGQGFLLHVRALGNDVLQVSYDCFDIFHGGLLTEQMDFLDADTPMPLQARIDEDIDMAARLFRFTTALVGRHLLQCMQWSWGVPGMFMLLVHPDQEVVRATLGRLEELWGLIVDSEALALTDSVIQARLKECVFLTWPWTREMFIILAEFGWQHVPKEVELQLRAFMTGLLGTLLNENAINHLNAMTEISRRGDLRRK